MSVRATVRALPTLLRIGVAEAVAYRAEMLIWVLSTTMPLVMMALWSAVAREAPVGRYDQPTVVAYFLAAFIVRQLTGAWAAWEINFEVRQGTLAMRLLRPIHPIWSYAMANLGAMPFRVVVAIPIAVTMLLTVGGALLPKTFGMWLLFFAALFGGWVVTFFANVIIGTFAFFMESSLKIMEVWYALFFVCSGYGIPIDLFPPWARSVLEWLPFRFQIGLAVELLTSAHSPAEAAAMVAKQWTYILVMAGVAFTAWRAGVKRFAAFGG